jgi:catechol 2,3-dioxygenase-like lactoylglutathione lyase family enzyme
VKFEFIAGFGPITRDANASLSFWRDAGFELAEIAPGYYGVDDVGVRAFALWPLSQAAEATFGSTDWPAELPVPQAWIELDVESAAGVAEAAAELESMGNRLLSEAREEPWGQTTARLLSPEGLLVGIAYTPWMHKKPDESSAAD